MVHRSQARPGHRAHHPGRGDHRVLERPEPGEPPGRHRRRPGREPVVHRRRHDQAIGRITPAGAITEFSSGLNRGTTRPASPPARTGSCGSPTRSDEGGGHDRRGGPGGERVRAAGRGVPEVGSPLSCVGDTWSTWAGVQPQLGLLGFDGYRWRRDGTPLADQVTRDLYPGARRPRPPDRVPGHRHLPAAGCQRVGAEPAGGDLPGADRPGAGARRAGGHRRPAPVSSAVPTTGARRLTVLRRARIVGLPRVGRTLRCTGARVRGASALAYSWRRGGRAIPGARRSSYTVRRADRGRLVACAVRASGAGGSVTTVSGAVRVRR